MLTIIACVLIVVFGLAALVGAIFCGVIGLVAVAWKVVLIMFGLWIIVKVIKGFQSKG